jgi:2'-5' RNA ligase
MRIFIAVFPPPGARAAAHAAGAGLRRAEAAGARVSWVKEENLHYTMRFLGELGEDGARRAGEAALQAAASIPAFDAQLGGPGAFPDARRARVLWLGLSTGAEALVALARALDRALEPRGFAAPDHPFSPHLTLGRIRDAGADWTAALARAQPAGGPEAGFRVERLTVVESTLSPRGSIYAVRLDAPLKA